MFLSPVDRRQRLELGTDADGNGSTFAGEPDGEKTSWSLEKDGRRQELVHHVQQDTRCSASRKRSIRGAEGPPWSVGATRSTRRRSRPP